MKNKQWKNYYLFWTLTDLFIILSGAVISFGRIDFGLRAAMPSRYISFSMLFWICTISMFTHAMEIRNHNMPVRKYIAFACIIIVFSVISGSSLIAARDKNETLNVFKTLMLKGEYDSDIFKEVFTKYVSPNIETARQINLYRKYAIRNFENAQPVNEEYFHDFIEIELNRDAFIQGSNNLHVENFQLIDKEHFSIGVWHKLKAEKCYVVLYGNDKAFIAPLHKSSRNIRPSMVKYQDPYDMFTRNYFTAERLYFGNLPEGTYDIAIKVSDKYYPVESISITK